MNSRVANWARIGYLVSAWLFLIGVVFQVFLAGISLFSPTATWESHIGFGYTLGFLILAFLVLGWLARLPRPLLLIMTLQIVVYIIQTLLPNFRDVSPIVAALHPVNAMLLAYICLVHVQRAQALVMASQSATAMPRQVAKQ